MLAEDSNSIASAGPEVVEAGGATAATAAVAAGTASHPPCDDDCSSAPASPRAHCALPSEAHAAGAAAVTSLGKGNAGGGAVASPPAVVHNADNSAAIAGLSSSARLPVPRRSASVGASAAQLAAAPSPTRTCAHSRLQTSAVTMPAWRVAARVGGRHVVGGAPRTSGRLTNVTQGANADVVATEGAAPVMSMSEGDATASFRARFALA